MALLLVVPVICGSDRASQASGVAGVVMVINEKTRTPAASLSVPWPRVRRMTWETRELPILRAIVAMADEDAWHIYPAEIAERSGLPESVVRTGLWALADDSGDPFFKFTDGSTMDGREMVTVTAPTGRARTAVGSWPTPESLAERIIAGFQQAANDAKTQEERTRWQALADGARKMSAGVLTGLATNVLTGVIT